MAFFVLIGLVFALIIYISLAKKKKRALLISIAILGLYHLYVRYSCGPNPWDVRVMKPMANAISDYIVKHGIPKSLSEIPGLPYRLEGCKREEYYADRHNKKVSKNQAFKFSIYEECIMTRDIKVTLASSIFFENNITSLGITLDSPNKTEYSIGMIKKGNESTYSIEVDIPRKYTSDGICNPLKQ